MKKLSDIEKEQKAIYDAQTKAFMKDRKENSKQKGLTMNFKQYLTTEAFKLVPTHLGSGKPNPNHPSYATHKAKYDADHKVERAPREKKAPEESPVKLHHIDAAIGHSYPDAEPYEHLARQFPALHRATGKSGSKLMDHLNKVAREKGGSKDFNDHVRKAHEDFEADNEYNSRHEAVQSPKLVKTMKENTMISFKEFRQEINELSNDTLGRYKKVAGQQATALDATANATGDSASRKLADKRFSGIMKATNKQFDNDAEAYRKTRLPQHESVNEAIKNISKAEFDALENKHKQAKQNNRTGKYAYANYVHQDKSGNVWSQTYSHNVHNLPTIETDGKTHRVFMKESVFDWKKNKSDIDWKKDNDPGVKTMTDTGMIHKAVAPKPADFPDMTNKKSVGRPKGEYGKYKIDTAKRQSPEYKTDLSKKIMAAKAENFAIRGEYKRSMNDAIKKRQAEIYNNK